MFGELPENFPFLYCFPEIIIVSLNVYKTVKGLLLKICYFYCILTKFRDSRYSDERQNVRQIMVKSSDSVISPRFSSYFSSSE